MSTPARGRSGSGMSRNPKARHRRPGRRPRRSRCASPQRAARLRLATGEADQEEEHSSSARQAQDRRPRAPRTRAAGSARSRGDQRGEQFRPHESATNEIANSKTSPCRPSVPSPQPQRRTQAPIREARVERSRRSDGRRAPCRQRRPRPRPTRAARARAKATRRAGHDGSRHAANRQASITTIGQNQTIDALLACHSPPAIALRRPFTRTGIRHRPRS